MAASAIITQAFRRYVQTSAFRANTGTKGLVGPSAVSGGHEGGYKVWKKLTIFVAAPSIILCAINCVLAHNNHPHEQPEFIKYDYLRVRTKRFPWGDGNHSLFHNPHTNPLPDGYEEVHH